MMNALKSNLTKKSHKNCLDNLLENLFGIIIVFGISQAGLQAAGIPSAVHYPLPLSEQPALMRAGEEPAELPNTSRAAVRVMSLPMHPYMTDAEQQQVVTALLPLL